MHQMKYQKDSGIVYPPTCALMIFAYLTRVARPNFRDTLSHQPVQYTSIQLSPNPSKTFKTTIALPPDLPLFDSGSTQSFQSVYYLLDDPGGGEGGVARLYPTGIAHRITPAGRGAG